LFSKKIKISNKKNSIIIKSIGKMEEQVIHLKKTKKVKQIEKTHLISDGKVRLKSKQFQIA
jgi:hypothetical protein